MRKQRTSLLSAGLLIAMLLLFSAGQAAAEPFTCSGKVDIGALMNTAKASFDLDNEDAVILLQARKEYWLPDGRLRTLVHQIVWIATDQGIDHYADLRIPFDSEKTTLKVLKLRTWRDGKWWPDSTAISPTAVVETLPFQLKKADEYTNLRETMLIHDGVELPCIMETAYVIEDKEPFRDGAEGLQLLRYDDPVVDSRFIFGLPEGAKSHLFASPGVPSPTKGMDEEFKVVTYMYRMGPLEPVGRPHTVDPAVYTPYVTWSTWDGWRELGKDLSNRFKAAMILNDALKDSIAELTRNAPVDVAKAKKITKFITSMTRWVGYDWRYWRESPRPAWETYETSYGHSLDRAVLAAALFKEAGFFVTPVFRSREFADVDVDVATTARYDDIAIWVSGDGLEAYFNPVTGELSNGLAPIFGRTVWLPGTNDPPVVRWSGEGESSRMTLRLRLRFDPEADQWSGHGFYAASGGFCPYDKMAGFKSEASDFLGGVVSGVIDGAELSDYNLSIFDRFSITSGYEFQAPLADEDQFGRIPVVVGDPADGLIDRLPHDVHLYEEKRESPVSLVGVLEQSVKLCLEPGDFDVVYTPEDARIENGAGLFRVTTERDNGKLIVTREIKLFKRVYSADKWPELRELLLAEKNERNRTVLLKNR